MSSIHIKNHHGIALFLDQLANHVYPSIKKDIEKGRTSQELYEALIEGYGDDAYFSLRDLRIGAYLGIVAVEFKVRAKIGEELRRIIA